ncbi:hypothetical protein V4Y03_15780 [Streptomyces sp. P9-A4]
MGLLLFGLYSFCEARWRKAAEHGTPAEQPTGAAGPGTRPDAPWQEELIRRRGTPTISRQNSPSATAPMMPSTIAAMTTVPHPCPSER